MDLRGTINFNQSDLVNDGQNEALKEEAKDKAQNDQKLEKLLDKSSNVLIKLSSIWPFDLFPKDIIVDTNKINIIYREFFFSERQRSILLKNVTDVFVDLDLWFASMKLIDRSYAENVLVIKYLPKADAIKARRIIQGLIVAVQNGIDLNTINSTELLSKIEELGKTNVDSSLQKS